MLLDKKSNVFSLCDTNGRREDFANAFQEYLKILSEINKNMEWGALPDSLAQYLFYKKAVEVSPGVFDKHSNYDSFLKDVDDHPEIKKALEELDLPHIKDIYSSVAASLFKESKFKTDVEGRARHYTNSLKKLGLVNEKRRLTSVGNLLLDVDSLKKDSLEEYLPVNKTNLVYLRQLLKTRVYFDSGYYAPFCLGILALLRKTQMQKSDFLDLVQLFNPTNFNISIEDYIDNFISSDGRKLCINYPEELENPRKLSRNVFMECFKNSKSPLITEIRWNFYSYLYDCVKRTSKASIKRLFGYYKKEIKNNGKVIKVQTYVDKAFNHGDRLFTKDDLKSISPDEFKSQFSKFYSDNLNKTLYRIFQETKFYESLDNYEDITHRIFSLTGIIKFSNGRVELLCPKICKCIFDEEKLKKMIYGKCEDVETAYKEYEEKDGCYFSKNTSLSGIFEYSSDDILSKENKIKEEYNEIDKSKIIAKALDEKNDAFRDIVASKYPIEEVKKILELFKNRSNDDIIRQKFKTCTSIPAICEFISGIAWYYFSGESVCLSESYRLTLSADFEPLACAPGGQGDILFKTPTRVVMLEVTMMDPSNQKRGEWEPVLRHAVNLKAEVDSEQGKEAITFFIADNLDENTINIWRAVYSVPLQSSGVNKKKTSGVIVMALSFDELSYLIDNSSGYDSFIKHIQDSFHAGGIPFDSNWRKKVLENMQG